MSTTPRIYVGTYAKYSNGSINGAWLDVTEYANHAEFIEAAKGLHADEAAPELMYQTYEGFPNAFYSESSINPALWDYLAADGDAAAKAAYVSNTGEWDADKFAESYYGKFDTDIDFAYQCVDDQCVLEGASELASRYFDYEAFARDGLIDGFYKVDTYYFHNC